MPTPPRAVKQLTANRATELPALERALERAADFLKLAKLYAEDGQSFTGGDRLELARQEIVGVLDQLNTFRAAPKKNSQKKPRTPAAAGTSSSSPNPPPS